jgi:hypothetical protein
MNKPALSKPAMVNTQFKKPVPRYMQANMAWLSKDKNAQDLQSSFATQNKSRRSSIATRLFKRQKSEISRMFEDPSKNPFDYDLDHTTDGGGDFKGLATQKKYFIINREDPDIQD